MSPSPATEKGFHAGRKPGNYGVTYPPEALTAEEIHAIFNSFRSLRDRALIALLWRTGLRISEACDLMLKDVDFINHAIQVMRGKGGKRRTVGIDDWALEQIRKWISVRRASASAALFVTRNGTRLYPSQIRAMLHKVGKKLGIQKRIHPHAFRHSLAAELAREGQPMAYVQRQLGHSSLGTTSKYLATIAPTEILDMMAKREAPWEEEP